MLTGRVHANADRHDLLRPSSPWRVLVWLAGLAKAFQRIQPKLQSGTGALPKEVYREPSTPWQMP